MKWSEGDGSRGDRLLAWLLAPPLVLGQMMVSARGGVAGAPELYYELGLSRQGFESGHWWELFTHAWLHAGWGHLWPNLLLVCWMGGKVAEYAGKGRFVTTLFAGVLAGGVLFLIAGSPGVLVGISGGAFALLCWLAVVQPGERLLSWLPLRNRSLGLGVLVASGGFMLLALIPWLRNSLGGWEGPLFQVSHACHFGGCLAGCLLGEGVKKSARPQRGRAL